jgi:hypothetical protein
VKIKINPRLTKSGGIIIYASTSAATAFTLGALVAFGAALAGLPRLITPPDAILDARAANLA